MKYIQDGTLSTATSVLVDSMGVLSLQGLQSNSKTKPLTIQSPAIDNPAIVGGSIKKMDSIEAGTLDISGAVELSADVEIGGNLNVQGSVVGTRPYMDSSDARFKIDVEPIKNALDTVSFLTGVGRSDLIYFNSTH